MIAIEQFKMPADQSGMMLSYTGIIALVMQGFGVGVLSSRMTDVTLMKFSTVLLTFAYLALVRNLLYYFKKYVEKSHNFITSI